MRIWTLLFILLICGQAQAGDWFKTVEVAGGLGMEYFKCRNTACGNFDIGDGVIGRFSVTQSIYSTEKFRIGAEWDHMSDISTNNNETPIDYFGLGMSYKFSWY